MLLLVALTSSSGIVYRFSFSLLFFSLFFFCYVMKFVQSTAMVSNFWDDIPRKKWRLKFALSFWMSIKLPIIMMIIDIFPYACFLKKTNLNCICWNFVLFLFLFEINFNLTKGKESWIIVFSPFVPMNSWIVWILFWIITDKTFFILSTQRINDVILDIENTTRNLAIIRGEFDP